MSLFQRMQKPQNDRQNWLPDPSLPYVIHHPGRDEEGESGEPFVCIRPGVRHVTGKDREYDELRYTTNREHICAGRESLCANTLIRIR